MAYRDQPDHHNGSYVSPFDKQYYDRGRSPDYGTRPKSRTGTDGSDYQPRDTSPAWDCHSVDSGSQPMQQPLKSAIGHAFEKSDAARVVDPDLIAQITEQVKKSVLDEIKSSGMAGPRNNGVRPRQCQHQTRFHPATCIPRLPRSAPTFQANHLRSATPYIATRCWMGTTVIFLPHVLREAHQ